MTRLLLVGISFCLLGTSIGCQTNSTRLRPQTDQAQDLPPVYPERDNKAGYSTQEQDNNKNNYVRENNNDYTKNNYTEDANNISNRSIRPNRSVGYWLNEAMENQIQKLAVVQEVKAVVARGRFGAYIGKRNAYIAIQLKKEVSRQEMRTLKQKITSIVKNIEPNVAHVYVSQNDQFMKAVLDYEKHVKVGSPDREMKKHILQLEKVREKE